jgi:hypothetical protein
LWSPATRHCCREQLQELISSPPVALTDDVGRVIFNRTVCSSGRPRQLRTSFLRQATVDLKTHKNRSVFMKIDKIGLNFIGLLKTDQFNLKFSKNEKNLKNP